MKLYSKIIGKGKPFIILHGFLGMGDNWKTLGKDFSEKGFEVHLVDQRNHGRSPHTEDFGYDVMAEDIKEYCEDKNLENIVLLGHSMGGKTAMKVATSYPDLVHNLIVVDIAPKYYEPHHQTILDGLTMLQNSELDSRGLADEKLEAYIPEWGVRQFLLKNLYWKEKGKLALRMNLDVLKEKVERVGKALNEEDKFEKDTLFVSGGSSNYIRKEDRELIKSHFPKSNIVTIKDAGHWVHAEKADDFFQVIMAFIDKFS